MTRAKIISRKVEFTGWHSLETVVVQHGSLKSEGWAKPMKREVYYCGGVVVGLLYHPETDQILLNEQFRIGALMAGDTHPWLLECAAGVIDDGEDHETAIRREAIEETGCEILDLEPIGKAYPSPGGSDEIFHLYCGRIGAPKTGHYGLETEGEEIKTHLFSATEAIALLDEGRITNAATIICLHWFARHHERLEKKWSKK
jgi:ADP-ribose pyrophosphatase